MLQLFSDTNVQVAVELTPRNIPSGVSTAVADRSLTADGCTIQLLSKPNS